ncbi:CoA transferase, partial [Chloroflexota bacterium]
YGRVQTVEDLIKDPHLRSRGRIIDVDHKGKKMPSIAPYPVLSETPGQLWKTWPQRPGENNEEIYSGVLGFSHDELVTLSNEGVI